MYDALEKAQGTEWEEQVKEYIEAKKSLDLARSFAQSALEDLSKVVNAVTAINNAFEKFNKALSSVV
jgi:DNA-binding transcriptional regulator YhcF (GntR family)